MKKFNLIINTYKYLLNTSSINNQLKLTLSSLCDQDPKKNQIFNTTKIAQNLFNFFKLDFYDCSICLGPSTNPYRIRPCKHIFCLRCIKIWMETSSRCPLCRGTISKIIKI